MAAAGVGQQREGRQQRDPSGCCVLRYLSPVVVGSLNEQLRNPELDTSGPDVPTRRRRLHLRAATARMKAAALGQDLDMHDAGEAQKRAPCPRPLAVSLQRVSPRGPPIASLGPPAGGPQLPSQLAALERSPLPRCPLSAPSSTCSWNFRLPLTPPHAEPPVPPISF